MIAMDVNGSGTDELIVISSINKIRLYAWSGNGMIQAGNEIDEKIIHKGDFTGDGMADLITRSGNNFFLYPGKSNVTEFLSTANRKNLGVFTNFESALVGNFFGNAKTGLMLREGATIKLYALKVTQTTSGTVYTFNNQIGEETLLLFGVPATVDVGDFNGDGKDDLIMTEIINGSDERNTRIYYSYGNGFKKSVNLGFLNHLKWYYRYHIADFNNDGVSDIVFWKDGNINNDEYIVNHTFMFKSQGVEEDFGFKSVNVNTRSKLVEPDPNAIRFGDYNIGDFNGNGETDILFQFSSEYGIPVNTIDSTNVKPPNDYIINQYHNLVDNSSPDDLITGITNGLGVYQKISYKAYHAGKYEPTKYPVMILNKPFTLVSKIETQNPQGGYYPPTEYEFSGLMLHAQGKGLLGFKRTQVTDQMTEVQTESQKELLIEGNYYYFPYDAFQYTKHKKTNNILSQTRTSYEVFRNNTIASNLVFKPIMTRSVTTQWDNDKKHSYIGMNAHWQDISGIDEQGNSILSYQIADEWASKPDLNPDNMHYITTQMTEYNYLTAGKWLITPKFHKTIYYSSEIPDKIIEQTEYTYNEQGLPETSTFYPQGNKNSMLALETNYNEYDPYGNLKKTTLSAINQPNMTDRVTNFEYDETNRFLAKKISKMTTGDDWIVYYKYDHKLGLLKSETMIDGNVTSFVYSSFGSLEETIHPDGTSDIINLNWCKPDPSVPNYATYASTQFTQPLGSEDKWNEKSVYYDAYGRKLRETVKNIQGKVIHNDYEYNLEGQLERVYEPYYIADGQGLFTSYRYDELGRLIETILPDESIDNITYLGRKTLTSRTKGDINITDETVVNIMGDTDMKKDAVMTINYNYDGKRRLRQTYVGTSVTEITYDEAGNRFQLIDPNAGTITYVYNAFGELTSQTDANGNNTKLTYIDGRTDQKVITSNGATLTYNYTYYLANSDNGFGQIASESCSNGTSIVYYYDALGRISQKSETINQNIFTFDYTYNPTSGMPETYTYPSGFKLKYTYNQRGDMTGIAGFFGSYWAGLWTGYLQNQRGQWTYYYSPAEVTTLQYDNFGFPSQTVSLKSLGSPVQDLRYQFNSTTGNLSWRRDALKNFREDFTYDTELHSRLTGWRINNQTVAAMQYLDNGNINQKTDVSTAPASYRYEHPQGKPHAVTSVAQPTAAFLNVAPEQNITYTPFNKVSFISNTYPNGRSYELDITYGPDQQRKYSRLEEDEGVGMPFITETYFLDQYETKRLLPSTEQKIHYLSGPTGLFGIMVQTGSNMQLYYVLTDYLGSITGITDASGNVLEKLSYDPWGRRRNPNNWTDYTVQPTHFDRGYTGHEHLDQFGLINMNGRVYDPFLARFLNPDPFVQAPEYSQNYNRYSYAWNNPLKYTDPSGEFIHLIIGAAIGGIANWIANGAQFNAAGLGHFGVGALAGGLAAGVGAGVGAVLAGNAAAGGGFAAGFVGTNTITSSGFVAGAVSGASAGFTNGLVSGTGNGIISGKKFEDAFVNGFNSAWKQGIGGAAIGGVMGSIDAIINKEDWLTGSPYKKYQYTDGQEVFGKSGVLNDKGIKLPNSDAPFSRDITPPSGWDLPTLQKDGYTMIGKNEIAPMLSRKGSNIINIEFPLGTKGGGFFGVKVEAPLRLLRNVNLKNNLFNYKYFYPNERSISPLFWFLK